VVVLAGRTPIWGIVRVAWKRIRASKYRWDTWWKRPRPRHARPTWRRRSVTLSSQEAGACGRGFASRLRKPAVTRIRAWLVQDDLPCFDDASVRRGRASLHERFGEAVAVLVGDALIVRAFAEVAEHIAAQPAACAQILQALAAAAGAPLGIAAGQAWESEAAVDVNAYHHAKTAALFEAAAVCGAIAAGGDVETWRHTGVLLGSAYQVADDIADALGESGRLGKPTHQDGNHARPSAVASLGTAGAVRLLDQRLHETMHSIPACSRRESVENFVEMAAQRLCPPELRNQLRHTA